MTGQCTDSAEVAGPAQAGPASVALTLSARGPGEHFRDGWGGRGPGDAVFL